jgi:hypothetical protein
MAIVDQRISDFKQKHVNELPELFSLNYRMADGIAEKLFTLEQKALMLRSQRRSLESELSTLSPVLGMTGLSGERIVTPQERLAALQAELGQLRARYSDRHPDVRRSLNEIAELKALLESQGSQESGSDLSREDYVSKQAGGAFNPTYTQLKLQLEEVKADMEAIELERKEYEAELKEYQRRVGMTPLVEKEWLILSRDREAAEKRFNDLANQVQTMESAAEMEKRELGGRLSIGQPPVIPLTPHKPNIPMILGISVFLGLCSGVGLLLGWDFIFKTVRMPHDVAPVFVSSVLVELPMVRTKGEGESLRVNTAYVRIALLVLVIGIVVAVDLFYMKVDVLLIKVFGLLQTKLALLGF